MHSDVGPGSLLQNSETVSTDLSSLRLGKEHLMNFNNRNNQILSMIAETQLMLTFWAILRRRGQSRLLMIPFALRPKDQQCLLD